MERRSRSRSPGASCRVVLLQAAAPTPSRAILCPTRRNLVDRMQVGRTRGRAQRANDDRQDDRVPDEKADAGRPTQSMMNVKYGTGVSLSRRIQWCGALRTLPRITFRRGREALPHASLRRQPARPGRRHVRRCGGRVSWVPLLPSFGIYIATILRVGSENSRRP